MFPQPVIGHATTKLEPVILQDTPKKAKLRELLKQDSPQFDFQETPLRDAVSEITNKCHVPIRLDIRALEDFGVDADTPITGASFPDDALGPALKRLLDPIDLTCLNDEHCVLITTKDKAAEQLETRLYPVPFLANDADALIDSITKTCCSTSWSSVGGLGTILRLGHTLVISQTEGNHAEILSFLQELEEHQGIEHGKLCTRVVHVEDPALATHLAALLVAECNASLGERADPAAKVSAYGSRVTIQSASRPFLVYAEELINSHKGQNTVRYEWCAPVSGAGGVRLYGNVDGATPADLSPGFLNGGGMGGGMF